MNQTDVPQEVLEVWRERAYDFGYRLGNSDVNNKRIYQHMREHYKGKDCEKAFNTGNWDGIRDLLSGNGIYEND